MVDDNDATAGNMYGAFQIQLFNDMLLGLVSHLVRLGNRGEKCQNLENMRLTTAIVRCVRSG